VNLLLEYSGNVRQENCEDAASGAKGAYRQFKRDCPIQSWQTIQQLING